MQIKSKGLVSFKLRYLTNILILCYVFFQKLLKFEKATGIEFNHIRLLARAFTLRSVGFNNLTL